jgi:hypothetical protein
MAYNATVSRKVNYRLLIQFAVSTGIVYIVFLAIHPHLNPKTPVFASLRPAILRWR